MANLTEKQRELVLKTVDSARQTGELLTEIEKPTVPEVLLCAIVMLLFIITMCVFPWIWLLNIYPF